MYVALGIVFLILSLALAAAIVITLVKSAKDGGELISKKNLFYLIPTFLLIYFLQLTAAVFKGEEIDFFYCFALVNTSLDIFKFKAVRALVAPICYAHPLFYADVVIAYLLGGATLILSVASFFSQRIKNFITVNRRFRKNCDVILGDSSNALKYHKNTKNSVILGINVTRNRYADLIKGGKTVLRAKFDANLLLKKLKRGVHNIIVFRDGKYPYTDAIEQFTLLRTSGCDVYLHLEANQDEMKILREKFISQADKSVLPYVSCFSKYELMARRFVTEHPITKYIPRSFYNDNLTLKEDKSINVVFVGFGKVNYQLFRSCAMQFQFAKQREGKLYSAPVNYHIYDSEDAALHNEFFSKILFEFEEDFKDCDFPKPEKICELDICNLDINSVNVKRDFKSFVNKDSFTYFVISLDEDLEDASYAQTVKRLLKDETNYRIFVRAKNDAGEQLLGENDPLIYFGEDKNLYSHAYIVNDGLMELAKRINLLYEEISVPAWVDKIKASSPDKQYKLLDESLKSKEHKNYLLNSWSKLHPIEQASNVYHALNLPFKLYLLGFGMELRVDENDTGITEEEFNARYVNSGRKGGYSDYSFYFGTERSNVLAFIEHSRWNALYILYDYKQMKKSDMRVEDNAISHKDVDKQQHACITTYYGLDELVKFKFNRLYPSENIKNDDTRLLFLAKVYRYDYMSLDRLYGEITAMGYKLVDTDKDN